MFPEQTLRFGVARITRDRVKPCQRPLDVAIEDGCTATLADGEDRSGTRAPDTGQRLQTIERIGEYAVIVIYNRLRCFVQIAGARVVAEPRPVMQDFVSRGSGERLNGWKAGEKIFVIGDDGRNLS